MHARALSTTTHIPLWLDGAATEALDGTTLPIEDPSTGEAFATTALVREFDRCPDFKCRASHVPRALHSVLTGLGGGH